MFAGPNGSGKTTLKSIVGASLLGTYINPDDIEAGIRERGYLKLDDFGVQSNAAEILGYFKSVRWLPESISREFALLRFTGGKLDFNGIPVNAYHASVAADFLRRKLLEQRASFSFETVMSAPDKVALLREAQASGYRTYLYYVATSDPSINEARVQNRVGLNGHAVPAAKIFERYYRSLALLLEAVRNTNRAYIFDNSDVKIAFLAEITDGKTVSIKRDRLPQWFIESFIGKLRLRP